MKWNRKVSEFGRFCTVLWLGRTTTSFAWKGATHSSTCRPRTVGQQRPWTTFYSSSSSSSSEHVTTDSDNESAMSPSSRFTLLEERMMFRGPVDRGFGRGGKKLGFPTANLPSSLFQNALVDVPNGVYFGWAVIEGGTEGASSSGRNVPHKAVVNVGISPTFEGEENPEKIIEAHLTRTKTTHDDNDSTLSDFYGETMRLQLDAFMRPEQKFPSFPELVAQITADVQDSNAALDTEPYKTFGSSDFLVQLDTPWVGNGGGDTDASWEKVDMNKFL